MSHRILIIEDHPANIKLVRDLLQLHGFQTTEVTTALEGLDVAENEQPDLILMDIELPGMDGLEATRRLKANPSTRDIPVVALTAYAMKGDEERALAAGCTAYISKPITIAGFMSSIEKVLAEA